MRGAAAALRARGGILYVWRDQAGMIRARAKPPVEALSFETFYGDGWTVQIDRGITSKPVRCWLIVRKRIPWPHFRAFDDPFPPSSISGGDIVGEILDGVFQ